MRTPCESYLNPAEVYLPETGDDRIRYPELLAQGGRVRVRHSAATLPLSLSADIAARVQGLRHTILPRLTAAEECELLRVS